MTTLVAEQRRRGGPKTQRDMSALPLKNVPKRGHKRLYWFANKYLKVPAGYGQGKPIKLRTWQKELAQGLFPDDCDRPSQGLISMPRGNGKSSLAAIMCLYALFADNVESPQVLIVASTHAQASIIFNMARRMIELSPELEQRAKIYKDKIVTPFNDGLLMPMPSEVNALQGYQPTLAVVDELHTVTAEIWESMLLSSGKRPDSLVLAVSTPAMQSDSVMKTLVDDARSDPDPDFYFKEYAADPTHETDCQHCWKVSNPALGDFLAANSLKKVRKTSRETAFRVYRLGLWPDRTDDGWIAQSALDAVLVDQPIAKGAKVVLGFDGSFSGDMTAIVAVTVEKQPKVELLKAWHPAQEAETDYRVPIEQVEDAIRQACKDYNVREVLADPYRWSRSLQVLAAERIPVVEFSQSLNRMSPATALATDAINNQNVRIVKNDTLCEHILNARVREDNRGVKIQKEQKDSKRKIDGAICFVMAHSRAHFLANKRGGRVYRSRG